MTHCHPKTLPSTDTGKSAHGARPPPDLQYWPGLGAMIVATDQLRARKGAVHLILDRGQLMVYARSIVRPEAYPLERHSSNRKSGQRRS